MSRKLLGNLERGRVFVISAPSGTGKTTLVKRLCDEFDAIERSITCTTRAPRSDETDGVDYHFLSVDEFTGHKEADEFLESAKVFDAYYGTLKQSVIELQNQGKHVVLVIDTQGAAQLRGKIDVTSVFIAPPSMDELKRRLKGRNTESEKIVDARLSCAQEEIEKGKGYDYFIVNEDLDVAYEVLKSIFIAEEHHIRRNNAE